MEPKEVNILSDREIIPKDDYIFSILGSKQELWKSIVYYSTVNYKDTSGSWNYYNDGKRWLFKMVQKKKTIFWAGLWQDTFRVTLYFGDKAEPLIQSSELPVSIKDEFRNGKKYGAIRGITIVMNDQSDMVNAQRLIAIKAKMK